MLDTVRIRKAFSKASTSYDTNALLQRNIARHFLSNIKTKNLSPERILDIGAGTGWLSRELSLLYKKSVFCIDSALGMALFAKTRPGLISIVAEAQNLPFKNNSFDCIVSNLAFQWVFDLDKAFSQVKRVLSPEGVFYFTCFSKETLSGLKEAFLNTLDNKDLFSYDLPDEDKIRSALNKNQLKCAGLISKRVCEEFSDLFSILRWLKSVGANSIGESIHIKRSDFSKASDYYRENFKSDGKVYANFEVIEGCAVK